MASVVSSQALYCFFSTPEITPRFQVRVQSGSGGGNSKVSPSDSALVIGEKDKKVGGRIDSWNASLKCGIKKKSVKDVISSDLDVLWDDGYGTKTAKDFFEGAKEMIRPDGGPPRWFCPTECGQPLKDSPILLFCPGIVGVGLGLTLHHKALGKVFEVRCLHIPVNDRTPFEGLVKFVEETVRLEHASSPNKPIYLVGDSFGGCLVLAVAARNPEIDLVVILANPGNPVEMARVNIEYRLPPRLQIEQLFQNLIALLPHLSDLVDIIPKDTLIRKLKLLKSAASYANSRLHAVKAEVLVLSSGNDHMLPSGDEAQRLTRTLKNCTVRYFKDNGHNILMEDGVNLLTVIKGTGKYRRSRRIDLVLDFIPPSMSEFKQGYDEVIGLLRFATGSAMFSTLNNGKIVKGLHGVPNEGPVLLVGYHMLMGLEVYSLVPEFLREKNIMVRGVTHPVVFRERQGVSSAEFSLADWMKVMGAVPVTASNLFNLLSTKSHVLLYPGGAREALHNRGEEYKLFWPDQQEFVRMAARFGATIVPFGTVGEDDVAELVLDYNDFMKIPVVNDYIRDANRNSIRLRDKSKGEVANQELYIPGILPKVPGRFYFLFGKPIETKGRKEEILEDRENANQLYLHIKSEVERCIAYLLKKREEDPYRSIVDRTVYRALHSPLHEVPAFDP
ncbi:phytyl ester synthase 1, chloroplastic-like isoform X2 [Populus nigra]|uniref:phytyl ester synthase 1, chloroplastic-like isoform X2 n=1 Tax=Populus nigra TaxID=3691 RepID=UPI002B279B16|nr:phytyl ester synthase 1, chloroplastic-like isoform X2 [Populus nigra]